MDKKCKSCGECKGTEMFYAHPKASDGRDSSCKECRKARVISNRLNNLAYYQEYDRNRPNKEERNKQVKGRTNALYSEDEAFREKVKKTKDAWAERNPHKRKAQHTLSNAVRDGKVDKPLNCEHCASSEKKIQGHHWSYLEEHWLDVIWLCTGCHGKEHRRLNALGRDPDLT